MIYFFRFMYNNLLTYQPGTSDSLFMVPSGGGKYQLKDGITFHLYISTAPCGDGALFSPRDASTAPITVDENDRQHKPTFSSNVQGVLRTKIEGGESKFVLCNVCFLFSQCSNFNPFINCFIRMH